MPRRRRTVKGVEREARGHDCYVVPAPRLACRIEDCRRNLGEVLQGRLEDGDFDMLNTEKVPDTFSSRRRSSPSHRQDPHFQPRGSSYLSPQR